MLKRGITI